MWAYNFDLETGDVSDKRLFVSDAGYASTVDGATVDTDGFIWNAKVLGGRIVRYRPDGIIDRVVDVPVRNVTSIMFGGPDLDILYFTSMGRPMRGIPPKGTRCRGPVRHSWSRGQRTSRDPVRWLTGNLKSKRG
ncbi:SMP-30/gluconolactonase/LRE family protein [Rhizobium leguminosarum]|nr:SMP-30/gluconolactonase/LRE family protein [Rhizobium leguminosarum]